MGRTLAEQFHHQRIGVPLAKSAGGRLQICVAPDSDLRGT
jgi:hypothetical protein